MSDRLFEALESRTLLSPTPPPDIADMLDPDHTVVRIETNFGDIDLEVYDDTRPISAANFLNYVTTGRYDNTFFHRLISGFVLQGGGFAFDDQAGGSAVETDDAILNEFDINAADLNLHNIARTVAYAKLGTDPNSATSQFFFNLVDNRGTPPNGLDFQNEGFTVFARVIDDTSWAVVQTIAGLRRDNFTQSGDGGGSIAGALPDTPVTAGHTLGQPLAESSLVNIVNAEIIKPQGVGDFYVHSAWSPEGFRGSTIVETVSLVNLSGVEAKFQIIARYEVASRDRVIEIDSLAANARVDIPISDFANTSLNLVEVGRPYAIEVQATQLIGASWRREDFGATSGEAFVYTGEFDDTTEAALETWTLGPFIKGDTSLNQNDAFLAWVNTSDSAATVTLRFYRSGFAPITVTRTTDAFRRDGLNINDTPWLPDGTYSVQLDSTQPLVAASSTYQRQIGTSSDNLIGMMAQGTLAGTSSLGALPAAGLQNGARPFISFTNSGSTVAIVSVTYRLTDGSELLGTPAVIPANSRLEYNVATSNVSLPTDQYFTIEYAAGSGSQEVSAIYYSDLRNDAVATPFATVGVTTWAFADAQLDPSSSTQESFISIYNPYNRSEVDFGYRLDFHFSDGTEISTSVADLDPLGRIDVDLTSVAALVNKVNSNPAAFGHFSIEVIAFGVESFTQVDGGGIVQYSFFDLASGAHNSFTTAMGSLSGGPISLLDPVFGRTGGS